MLWKNAFIRNKLNLADYIYAFSSYTEFLEDDNLGNLALGLELTDLSKNGKYEDYSIKSRPNWTPVLSTIFFLSFRKDFKRDGII